MKDKYQPISCDFHELLLAHATLKQHVDIVYVNEKIEETTSGVIIDVYTKKGEEFLVLDNKKTIRLDFIISVNGEKLPDISCTF
jgi:Rho-binding antiterminator